MNPQAVIIETSTPATEARAQMAAQARQRPSGMSYKFQRLREKLRAAIDSGELNGKLPGERALAKRFHVNAKTLSKALTDLAAEGILDRSIGRGTYVKGTAPAATSLGKWLLLCDDAGQKANESIIAAVQRINPDAVVSCGTDPQEMRPSFINQFSAVIDLAAATPEAFLRDLVVRNVPLVAIGREPKMYSMHCVISDNTLATSRLGRDLLLAGHRRLATVEPLGQSALALSLRQVAKRIAPEAVIDTCVPTDLRAMVEHGITAFVCDSPETAKLARTHLEEAGIATPGRVCLAAIGCAGAADIVCSGYYVTAEQLVDAAVGLLRESSTLTRPATLWLAGEYVDRHTVGAATAPVDQEGTFKMVPGTALPA